MIFGGCRRPGASRGRSFRGRALASALLLGFVATAVGAGPAAAQTAKEVDASLDGLFGGHASTQRFLETLKAAVAIDDRPGVAALVAYPLKTRMGGKAVTVKDAARFVAGYDKIMTDKVKTAIGRQTYAGLFANWQGVMIGDGEVWFSPLDNSDKVRITAINN